MLHQYLLDEQFEQSLVDPCVYTRIKDESKVTIIGSVRSGYPIEGAAALGFRHVFFAVHRA